MQENITKSRPVTEAEIDGSNISIRTESDGKISVRMDLELFIDLSDILREFAQCAERDVSDKQATLNFAMSKFIASTSHYVTENLGALTYYNELSTAIAKSQHRLLTLQPVFCKHPL